ncbi:hypothetical protein AAMO2058_000754300 [Amorphochlora amoebiformis]
MAAHGRLGLIKHIQQKSTQRSESTSEQDLDLTYITKRIIAMGFPATGLEATFRNPRRKVVEFLDKRHGKEHYRVFNLCAERSCQYPSSVFHGNVLFYPIHSNNPCPLFMVADFCLEAETFLRSDSSNIIAVHCKTGKGRTGFMISCLLVHLGVDPSARHAITHFTAKRCFEGTAITQPSQRRYLDYWEGITRAGKMIVKTPLGYEMRLLPKKLNLYEVQVNSRPFGMSIGDRLIVSDVKGQALESGIRKGDILLIIDSSRVTPSTWLDHYANAKPPFKMTLRRRPKHRIHHHNTPRKGSKRRAGSFRASDLPALGRRGKSVPPSERVAQIKSGRARVSPMMVSGSGSSTRKRRSQTSGAHSSPMKKKEESKFKSKSIDGRRLIINHRASAPGGRSLPFDMVREKEEDAKVIRPAEREWDEFNITPPMIKGFKEAFSQHQKTFPLHSTREVMITTIAMRIQEPADLEEFDLDEDEDDDEDADMFAEMEMEWAREGSSVWNFRPSEPGGGGGQDEEGDDAAMFEGFSLDEDALEGMEDEDEINQNDFEGFDLPSGQASPRGISRPLTPEPKSPRTAPRLSKSEKGSSVTMLRISVESDSRDTKQATNIAKSTPSLPAMSMLPSLDSIPSRERIKSVDPTRRKPRLSRKTSRRLKNALWLPDVHRGTLKLTSIAIKNATKEHDRLQFYVFASGELLLQTESLISESGVFRVLVNREIRGDVSVVATAKARSINTSRPASRSKNSEKPVLRFWFHTALVDKVNLVAKKSDIDIACRKEKKDKKNVFNERTTLTLSFSFSRKELKQIRKDTSEAARPWSPPSPEMTLAGKNTKKVTALVFRRNVLLRIYSKNEISKASERTKKLMLGSSVSPLAAQTPESTSRQSMVGGRKFLLDSKKPLRKIKTFGFALRKGGKSDQLDIISVRAETERMIVKPKKHRRTPSFWARNRMKKNAMYTLIVATESRLWQANKTLKDILLLYKKMCSKYPRHFSYKGSKQKRDLLPQCLIDLREGDKNSENRAPTRLDAITSFLAKAVRLKIKEVLIFLRDQMQSVNPARPHLRRLRTAPQRIRRATVFGGSNSTLDVDNNKCRARDCKDTCDKYLRYCDRHFEEFFSFVDADDDDFFGSHSGLGSGVGSELGLGSDKFLTKTDRSQMLMLIQLGLLDVHCNVSSASGVSQYLLRCLVSQHEYMAWSNNLQLAVDWESPDPMLQLLLQAIRNARNHPCTCPRSCKNFQIRLALVTRMMNVFDQNLTSKVDYRRCLTIRMLWTLLNGAFRLPICRRFHALGNPSFASRFALRMITKASEAGTTPQFISTFMDFIFEVPPPPEVPGVVTSPGLIPSLLASIQNTSIGSIKLVLERLANSVETKRDPAYLCKNAHRLTRLRGFAREIACVISSLTPFERSRGESRILNLGTGSDADSVKATRKLLAGLLYGGFANFPIRDFAPRLWAALAEQVGWGKRSKSFAKSVVSSFLELAIAKMSVRPPSPTKKRSAINWDKEEKKQDKALLVESCLEAMAIVFDLVLFRDYQVRLMDISSTGSPRMINSMHKPPSLQNTFTAKGLSAATPRALSGTPTPRERKPVVPGRRGEKIVDTLTKRFQEKYGKKPQSKGQGSDPTLNRGKTSKSNSKPLNNRIRSLSSSPNLRALAYASSSGVEATPGAIRVIGSSPTLCLRGILLLDPAQCNADVRLLDLAKQLATKVAHQLTSKSSVKDGSEAKASRLLKVERVIKKSRNRRMLATLETELKLGSSTLLQGIVERIVSFKDDNLSANTVKYFLRISGTILEVNPGVAFSRTQSTQVNLSTAVASEFDPRTLYALQISTPLEVFVLAFNSKARMELWLMEIRLASEYARSKGILMDKKSDEMNKIIGLRKGRPYPVGTKCLECGSTFSLFTSRVSCDSCGKEFCKSCCKAHTSGEQKKKKQKKRIDSTKTSKEDIKNALDLKSLGAAQKRAEEKLVSISRLMNLTLSDKNEPVSVGHPSRRTQSVDVATIPE